MYHIELFETKCSSEAAAAATDTSQEILDSSQDLDTSQDTSQDEGIAGEEPEGQEPLPAPVVEAEEPEDVQTFADSEPQPEAFAEAEEPVS